MFKVNCIINSDYYFFFLLLDIILSTKDCAKLGSRIACMVILGVVA